MAKVIKHGELVFFLLQLGTFLTSLACPDCPYPTPPKLPPKLPPIHKPPSIPTPTPPVIVKPPPNPPTVHPPPPVIVKPPPNPPTVNPPPPVIIKPPPTPIPNPPTVHPPPPVIIKPPTVHPPNPPVIVHPPPCPPPPPPPCPPPPPPTCPIDTLKLGVCVDALGGLIHIGLGGSAKSTCCPLLEGVSDLDAAVCLCTTIKAKLLNLPILIPVALELLLDCGKTPPPGFDCPP